MRRNVSPSLLLIALFSIFCTPAKAKESPCSISPSKIYLEINKEDTYPEMDKNLVNLLHKKLEIATCIEVLSTDSKSFYELTENSYQLELIFFSQSELQIRFSSLQTTEEKNLFLPSDLDSLSNQIAEFVYQQIFHFQVDFEKELLYIQKTIDKNSSSQHILMKSDLSHISTTQISSKEEHISALSLSPDHRYVSYQKKSSTEALEFIIRDLDYIKDIKSSFKIPSSALSPLSFNKNCNLAYYSRFSGKKYSVFEYNFLNQSSRILNLIGNEQMSPQIHPENGDIYFQADTKAPQFYSVYRKSSNSYREPEIVSNYMSNIKSPEISPKGDKIAYSVTQSSSLNPIMVQTLEKKEFLKLRNFTDINSANWHTNDSLFLTTNHLQENLFLSDDRGKNWFQLRSYKNIHSVLSLDKNKEALCNF